MDVRNKRYRPIAFIAVLAMMFLIIRCTSQEKGTAQSNASQKPVIDQSTPDKAVLSFWALQLYESEQGIKAMKTRESNKLFSAKSRSEIFVDQERSITNLKNEKKSIEKVEIQSDTRAVVYVKEAKYGPGSTMSDWKYIFGKEKRGWVLEDVMTFCDFCKGKGEVDDYINAKPNIGYIPKKKCNICCGIGWSSGVYHCDKTK